VSVAVATGRALLRGRRPVHSSSSVTSAITSSQAGRSDAPSGPSSKSPGQAFAIFLGNTAWIPANGVIYESNDRGRTWRTQSTTTKAGSFEQLSLISDTSAIGIATDAGCAQFKSDCYSEHYLINTIDAGRTWSTI
jgi:hypothetical protein